MSGHASKSNPFRFETVDPIGDVLTVTNTEATVPDEYLPRRVTLDSFFANGLGGPIQVWQARHDGGLISMPRVQGSGEDNLEQLKGWLARHGFRDVTPNDGPHPGMPPVWERTA